MLLQVSMLQKKVGGVLNSLIDKFSPMSAKSTNAIESFFECTKLKAFKKKTNITNLNLLQFYSKILILIAIKKKK
jgi:hypothetical protein